MTDQRRIFLVGPMGAGKTTIGRVLATELALPFFDTDKVIEERSGADIAWIFDVEGESGFRERESTVLDELSQQTPLLLATGGGIVLKEVNRQFLRSRGGCCLSAHQRGAADRAHEQRPQTTAIAKKRIPRRC